MVMSWVNPRVGIFLIYCGYGAGLEIKAHQYPGFQSGYRNHAIDHYAVILSSAAIEQVEVLQGSAESICRTHHSHLFGVDS